MSSPRQTFTGRVVLVTGGALRLGRAIGQALASQGAGLVVHYRSSGEQAEQLADEVRHAGGRAWTLQGDLGDPAIAADLVPRAIGCAGRLDVLVNNASIFETSGLTTVSEEDILRNIQIHAMAPLACSRSLAAAADPPGDDGPGPVILNMLDTRVVDYDDAHVAYQISKRMLFSLTRMLALELAPAVRVNAVAPGLVLPPPDEDESYLQAQAHTVPLQAHGCAQDVVDAAMYLLTAPFVTGQVIYVDGGRHMKGKVYG